MSEELKDNMCKIELNCFGAWGKQCLYAHTESDIFYCRHVVHGKCTSTVARANAMVNELKKMGLEIEIKNKELMEG